MGATMELIPRNEADYDTRNAPHWIDVLHQKRLHGCTEHNTNLQVRSL